MFYSIFSWIQQVFTLLSDFKLRFVIDNQVFNISWLVICVAGIIFCFLINAFWKGVRT